MLQQQKTNSVTHLNYFPKAVLQNEVLHVFKMLLQTVQHEAK